MENSQGFLFFDGISTSTIKTIRAEKEEKPKQNPDYRLHEMTICGDWSRL